MERLVASWEVFAGVIPAQIMTEYSKRWLYTSSDYETDIANANDGKQENRFTEMMKEAHDYALSLTDPRRVNWVRTDFLWL